MDWYQDVDADEVPVVDDFQEEEEEAEQFEEGSEVGDDNRECLDSYFAAVHESLLET